MNGKLSWAVFWALVGIFVVIASGFSVAAVGEFFRGFRFLLFITISGATFFLLGVALIFFTVKEKVGGMPKKFLLLTGASAVGFLLFILLHNAIYGLFGVEEAVFFIIAVFLAPAAFLVGVVGSIVLAVRRRRMAKKSLPSSP